MTASAIQIAQDLTAAAERARLDGDVVASLSLAFLAAQYVHLAKLLRDDRRGGGHDTARPRPTDARSETC